METAAFDYDLPDARHRPAPGRTPRSGPLLLDPTCGARPTASPSTGIVRDLPTCSGPATSWWSTPPGCCRPGSTCARPPAARSRCCCSSDLGDGRWEALVRPGRRVAPGTGLVAGRRPAPRWSGSDSTTAAGWSTVDTDDLLAALDAHGEVPLPPYIHEPLDDPERYQTVFAARPGSVAAPTAGLHLTDAVLDGIRVAGAIDRSTVDLVVGSGHLPADHAPTGSRTT